MKKNNFILLFSGKSGDGIQFIGNLFANNAIYNGYNIKTLSNFPSEIQTPHYIQDNSSFQINFGIEKKVTYIGDKVDFLISMNFFSLKKNINKVKKNGIILLDDYNFYPNNIKKILNNYSYNFLKIKNIIENIIINKSYFFIKSKLINKIKNIFILGFVCSYFYNNYKFIKPICRILLKNNLNKDLLNANIFFLKKGFNFGLKKNKIKIEINNKIELINKKKINNLIKKNKLIYINGNEAISLGIIYACKKAKLNLFFSSYPITPSSSIIHFLFKNKNKNIKIFQAEDEISAITSAIGASYAGSMGVTSTSGPGMSLKQEAIGLAIILELPLLIINVQRSGPSTGIPTKSEQSDLMQALYGRHGISSIPVFSSSSPSNCFEIAYNSIKVAIEKMTPVILLSEGILSNSSEKFFLPKLSKLENIKIFKKKTYKPYYRNNNFVRPWIVPGTYGLEHTIGSLEKEHITGKVSYEYKNHNLMIKIREKKINYIYNYNFYKKNIIGNDFGKILLIGWGSTYDIIISVINSLPKKDSYFISYIHINYINPFPKWIKDVIFNFKKVIIIELNQGQLINIIRYKFLIDAIPLNPYTLNSEKLKTNYIIYNIKKILNNL
ncbi:2-oxoacid:acceptor oxidoreductase family protein [Candidatus Shikimatogenerans silvanidophilus]|uniref:2-oxoacid:acceptor oxidoreductase family protein n=1 Tax=Candidatus Shikimatogenerans silvanidophilus TaxID=2782547 RepID=UPI001BA77260|nr:2-oxoacid:acceptor oxidoreductase family protein [Candidatus Shikimatogenerans silvanidophilus]